MNETTETREPQAAPASESDAGQPAQTPARNGAVSEGVLWLANTLVIVLFVITFLVQAFQIPSESMEQTLLIGDYLLVDKVHYARPGTWGELLPYTDIKRGDIIVFRYPVQPAQFFVKRVIGLPGDHIRLVDKRVYVNGQLMDEPYVMFQRHSFDAYRDYFPNFSAPRADVEERWWSEMQSAVRNGELVVPRDHYFVMGDNRDNSLDSRYWGFVPRENIVGQPLMIYWSVGLPAGRRELTTGAGGKLWSFVSSIGRFFQDTRWERTLRLVK